jgi:hypothetical protein
MQISSTKIKGFLAVATSTIATSLIAIIPAQAATLSSSLANFKLNNFSISPEDVITFTDTDSNAVSLTGQGTATSDAIANASFITDLINTQETFATNDSSSQANGDGKNYFAFGKSFAQVAGLAFQVAEGETFSFDFQGLLNLKTSIDDPEIETATANASIWLAIFDQGTGETLDFFNAVANLSTPNNQDSFAINNSKNIFFNPNGKSSNIRFGGNQESAQASIQGYYSRQFAESRTLGLVELKSNYASVAVPEPQSMYPVLFGGLTLLVVAKKKGKFRQL